MIFAILQIYVFLYICNYVQLPCIVISSFNLCSINFINQGHVVYFTLEITRDRTF